MSEHVARFTISVPPELLSSFDEVSAKKGYASRSEAVRDAIRDYLIAHEWSAEGGGAEVLGTITLVSGSSERQGAAALAGFQSNGGGRVLSALQVPMDAGSFLEVIVVRGQQGAVAELADALISLRGVKFGRLVCATTGAGLL